MEFYDLYVRMDDVEEAVEFGERLGFDGIGVCHKFKTNEELSDFIGEVKEVDKDASIDVVSCCEMEAESVKEMKRGLEKTRQKSEVVIVKGGDFDVNKAASRDSRVDILCQPEYNRRDSGMDHKTMRIAGENDVVIGVVLQPILTTYGKVRSHILNHIKRNLRLCEEYGAEAIVTSGANEKYEMRDPRELASLVKVLGMKSNEAMKMVSSRPSEIVKENRKKLEGKVKKSGVEETH